MTEQRATVASPVKRPAERAETRWLAPFLFSIAIVAETLSLLLMTIYRYRSQLLEPDFFDVGKTANLLGFLFESPFLLLFLMLLAMKRFHSPRLAALAAAGAATGLVALTMAPMFQFTPGAPVYTGYLIFLAIKALELGIFAAALRRMAEPWWRRATRAVMVALGLMAATFAAVIGAVLLSPFGSSITERPRQAYDAGVILGAAVWSGDKPSPVLRERINRGFDLLREGNVQFLVLTGGNAPHELPEAEVARRELLKRGADPTRIVTETNTSSTLEQILYIRDQLQKKQGWSSFIIISDQFHLKRALEICQFNGINAIGVSSESPLGPQNLALYHLRESGALILYWLFGV
jgi:vancomycin permeability regulator SanA